MSSEIMARQEMGVNFAGATPQGSEIMKFVGQTAAAFPKEHPYATGVILATATAGIVDVSTAHALSENFKPFSQEVYGFPRNVINYIANNGDWLVPVAAVVDGLIDAGHEMKVENDRRSMINQQISEIEAKDQSKKGIYKRETSTTAMDFWKSAFENTYKKGMQTFVLTLATKQVEIAFVTEKNLEANISSIVILFYTPYAFLPDSWSDKIENGVTKSAEWALSLIKLTNKSAAKTSLPRG